MYILLSGGPPFLSMKMTPTMMGVMMIQSRELKCLHVCENYFASFVQEDDAHARTDLEESLI